MTEIISPMRAVEVDKACQCGIGRMRPNGVTLLSNPPLYEHMCSECGNKAAYQVRYPFIRHEPGEVA